MVTPWFPSLKLPVSGVFNLRDVELLARDHDVEVLHLISPELVTDEEPQDGEAAPGIHVRRVPFSSSRLDLIRSATAEVRAAAGGKDLIHSMAFPALRPVASAKTGLPWVHTEHWSGLVSKPTTLRARVGGIVLRRWLRYPDATVAVGQQLASVVDRYRTRPTAVIGNRVRLSEPGQLPEPPEQRGEGPLRLIGVGNLIPWKGPIEVVEAVAELRSRGIDASLEWAGTGKLDDDVKSRAIELGIDDRVHLLGHLTPEQLSDALLRAHMFVLPTQGETFGVAIAEAIGHGLPVVASGAGGHRGFLPPQASRIVDERSGSALADAIVDLAGDPVRWSGEKIASYARGSFSEESRAAAYRNVYADAVQRAARRRR